MPDDLLPLATREHSPSNQPSRQARPNQAENISIIVTHLLFSEMGNFEYIHVFVSVCSMMHFNDVSCNWSELHRRHVKMLETERSLAVLSMWSSAVQGAAVMMKDLKCSRPKYSCVHACVRACVRQEPNSMVPQGQNDDDLTLMIQRFISW